MEAWKAKCFKLENHRGYSVELNPPDFPFSPLESEILSCQKGAGEGGDDSALRILWGWGTCNWGQNLACSFSKWRTAFTGQASCVFEPLRAHQHAAASSRSLFWNQYCVQRLSPVFRCIATHEQNLVIIRLDFSWSPFFSQCISNSGIIKKKSLLNQWSPEERAVM